MHDSSCTGVHGWFKNVVEKAGWILTKSNVDPEDMRCYNRDVAKLVNALGKHLQCPSHKSEVEHMLKHLQNLLMNLERFQGLSTSVVVNTGMMPVASNIGMIPTAMTGRMIGGTKKKGSKKGSKKGTKKNKKKDEEDEEAENADYDARMSRLSVGMWGGAKKSSKKGTKKSSKKGSKKVNKKH